jgi:hypothetical protein
VLHARGGEIDFDALAVLEDEDVDKLLRDVDGLMAGYDIEEDVDQDDKDNKDDEDQGDENE